MPTVSIAPERRPSWATLAALSVATGAAAVALGGWALVTADSGTRTDASTVSPRELALERTVSVLASPGTVRIPLQASAGRLVLVTSESGDGVLIVRGLGRAVGGRTYQAWVADPGSSDLRSAGLFEGSEQFVPLSRRVLLGGRVSVTVEDAGGARSPSRVPRLTAVRG